MDDPAAIRLADPAPQPMPDLEPARLAIPPHELALVAPLALDRHPVAVYLARLAPSSRRTMRAALDAIASLC